jgi:hypothetical protein
MALIGEHNSLKTAYFFDVRACVLVLENASHVNNTGINC